MNIFQPNWNKDKKFQPFCPINQAFIKTFFANNHNLYGCNVGSPRTKSTKAFLSSYLVFGSFATKWEALISDPPFGKKNQAINVTTSSGWHKMAKPSQMPFPMAQHDRFYHHTPVVRYAMQVWAYFFPHPLEWLSNANGASHLLNLRQPQGCPDRHYFIGNKVSNRPRPH